MTRDIRIAIESPDRRSLLARLCDELGRALAPDGQWERDDAVVPWHASAGTFEDLPGRMIAAVLDEWAETGARLAGVEFSGYLETDHGPRAWGSLIVREVTAGEAPPEIDSLATERIEGGYRLQARLRRSTPARGSVDG
jgi:hypothetical protein